MHPNLAEQTMHVGVDRVRGDPDRPTDRRFALSVEQPLDHLQLSRAQAQLTYYASPRLIRQNATRRSQSPGLATRIPCDLGHRHLGEPRTARKTPGDRRNGGLRHVPPRRNAGFINLRQGVFRGGVTRTCHHQSCCCEEGEEHGRSGARLGKRGNNHARHLVA